MKLNPAFETKVGNIKIKLANEYMFTWLELQMAGDKTNAGIFAGKAEYPDSLLALAKAYLSSAPANSVLITSGDNDTYPLWYLQQIKNIRTDVAVINYNLIGFQRYLHFEDTKSKQRLFATRGTTYLRDGIDYFLFENAVDSGAGLDVDSFIGQLLAGRNPYDTTASRPYKGGTIKTYFAKHLWFEAAGKKSSKIELDRYLLLNEFILLDIMNTMGRGKVAATYRIDLVAPLLKQEGYVYVFDY